MFQQDQGMGGNPMMTAPRSPNFKDAQTSYGGGAVNSQTQGLNPYVQFAPNRMNQLQAMMNMRRQPQQMMPQEYHQDEGANRPRGPRQAPPDDQKQVPILGRTGTVMGYGWADNGSPAYARSAQTYGM